jgi:hypothetical protein
VAEVVPCQGVLAVLGADLGQVLLLALVKGFLRLPDDVGVGCVRSSKERMILDSLVYFDYSSSNVK